MARPVVNQTIVRVLASLFLAIEKNICQYFLPCQKPEHSSQNMFVVCCLGEIKGAYGWLDLL